MTTISTSSTDAAFRAGGLASGMDTNSIIDQLVALESKPLNLLRTQQSGLKTQISALGDIVSRLSDLGSVAADLGTNGVLASATAGSNSAFTAAPGTNAVPGSYSVQVLQLAQASKWRSQPFAAGAGHPGGTLQLTVAGKTYDPITVADGASLADVAAAIRAQGAPVSAVVLNDGTNSYLSLTATSTGLPTGGGAALAVAFTPTVAAAPGATPLYAETQAARNSSVSVDGLLFGRPTNTLTDVIPGTTLTLQKQGGPAEDLVVATNVDGSRARLQKLVDAYDGVMTLVQRQLHPAKDQDRSASLTGDASVRTLQSALQRIVTTQVGGSTVRTLADLGVKTARDGSLSIDANTFAAALARDPAAVNGLFSTATQGVSAVVQTMVDLQTRPGDGILVARQSGLGASVQSMDDQAAVLQRRIDAYRQNLVNQFTAMESIVSSLKSIGSFLSSQSTSTSK